MPTQHALAAAIALADYLETYTSDLRLENIGRLAEALQLVANGGNWSVVSPQHLGNLMEALPADVLRQLKFNGAHRA